MKIIIIIIILNKEKHKAIAEFVLMTDAVSDLLTWKCEKSGAQV